MPLLFSFDASTPRMLHARWMRLSRVCWVALSVCGLMVGLSAAPARAAEPIQAGATHRGIVPAGPYQIFPENRFSNGVYLDGVLLVTVPGQTILSAAQIAPGGRLIYLARGTDGKRTIGVRTAPNDVAPRITEPAKGYQYVVAGFDNQGYKKFFKITDAAVTDLLPASRTADGLTIGTKGVLFFHISSSPGSAPPSVGANPATIAPSGTETSAATGYGIRLHFLNLDTGTVKHLGRTIYGALPTIKLAWIDDEQFAYTLSDGKSETLKVSDFK